MPMMMCTYTSVFWHIRARRGSALRHKSDVYGYANTDDYCPYRRGDFVAVPSSTGNARATVCRTVAYNVPTLFRFYVYISSHLIKREQRSLLAMPSVKMVGWNPRKNICVISEICVL